MKNGKNKYYLGKAYFALSDYYDYNNPNEIAEKIRLVELASKAFHQSENIERQAFTLTFLADLYQLNNERPKALGKLDTALELYKSIGFKKLQSVYILYATIYHLDNLFRQSLNYGLMALSNANSLGDTSMTLCQIYNHIGMTLNDLKEPDKAIDYFLKAFEVAEKYKGNNSITLMANVVQTYFKLRKPEAALAFMKTVPESLLNRKVEADYIYIYIPHCYLMIYSDLKRYAEAQVYVDEILRLIKLYTPPARALYSFYYIIAKYYLSTREYPVARTYMGKLDSIKDQLGDINVDRSNFLLKFQLDTALGHFESAVTNLLAFRQLNDSLFNETSNKQIKQLEIEYETEKNKNKISELDQKNRLAQNRLDRSQLVKKITIGGVALLFIIVALLFWQYRVKQQNNEVILQKNEQLEHLLSEKEWLVKEIHHRVKNNFHIVASLLEIQSSYLKNKEALSAIKESQHRIHSMSIIHQKLYQSETLSTIYMPEYIYELVEYLRESYAIRENIGFSLQIENIELNHASAITLGLILNEAITNSIKYAFADTVEGKISITLSHISDSQILLSISDNGKGLPAGFNSHVGASMGMELLQGLTDDIGGSFSIENNDGTQIKIIFTNKAMSNSDGSFRS